MKHVSYFRGRLICLHKYKEMLEKRVSKVAFRFNPARTHPDNTREFIGPGSMDVRLMTSRNKCHDQLKMTGSPGGGGMFAGARKA